MPDESCSILFYYTYILYGAGSYNWNNARFKNRRSWVRFPRDHHPPAPLSLFKLRAVELIKLSLVSRRKRISHTLHFKNVPNQDTC